MMLPLYVWSKLGLGFAPKKTANLAALIGKAGQRYNPQNSRDA